MNYGQIFNADVANGPGMRVSLFVSGCTHHCPGCFNQDTWDFNYGVPFTVQTETELYDMLDKPYIRGLTVLGGEPFELPNQESLIFVIPKVKTLFPDKDIWVYSGYLFEELTGQKSSRCRGPYTDDLLKNIDVLVDGEFVMAEKDITLKFRGSRNQRVLDMPASLKAGQPVWMEEFR